MNKIHISGSGHKVTSHDQDEEHNLFSKLLMKRYGPIVRRKVLSKDLDICSRPPLRHGAKSRRGYRPILILVQDDKRGTIPISGHLWKRAGKSFKVPA